MDTIAAQATPPGNGGVGIIRISGKETARLARGFLGKLPSPRVAEYLPFYSSSKHVIDYGLALYFPGPNSFTGEDVLELQAHGGQVVMDMLLQEALSQGARTALPGEFSQRAFLNDKIDLAQAEAIADLINASSEAAAKSAMNSLSGKFSQEIHALVEQLIETRMHVESAIDFPEEEIDFLADEVVLSKVDSVRSALLRTLDNARQGHVLNEGMTIVILGQPNAGKSSLMNYLSGRDTAIVTEIAGTTRDILREHINIDGLPLRFVDTAGLREQADIVEKEGIRRAWEAVANADCVLFLVDDAKGLSDMDRDIQRKLPEKIPVVLVFNKIDVSERLPGAVADSEIPSFAVSAKSGAGFPQLKEYLKQLMGYRGQTEGIFLARRRHLDALHRALELVEHGRAELVSSMAGELLAEDLRQAQMALSEITGEFTSDDLLGRIFSSFCIGK